MPTPSVHSVTSPDKDAGLGNWELTKLPRNTRPKATAGHYRILLHRPLGERYMAVTLYAPAIAEAAQPGQFLMLTAARRGRKDPSTTSTHGHILGRCRDRDC